MPSGRTLAGVHGAARRRRECLLRQHWRHEQLSLQMVLATVQHHSYGAPRGQTTATRTRAEERETYSAPRRQEASSAHSHSKHAVLHAGRRERAGDGVAADRSGRAAGATGETAAKHWVLQRRESFVRVKILDVLCASDG